MRTASFTLITLLAVGSLWAAAPQKSAAPVKVTKDDVRIYELLLEHRAAKDSKGVVVRVETDGRHITSYSSPEDEQKFVDYVTKQVKDPSIRADQLKSLLRDLQKRNQKQSSIPQIGPKDKIVMVPAAELDKIFSEGFWKAFYKKFPGKDGLFTASLPAYSKDGKLAVVYWSHSVAGLAGSGWLSFFRKSGDKWSSAGHVILWKS